MKIEQMEDIIEVLMDVSVVCLDMPGYQRAEVRSHKTIWDNRRNQIIKELTEEIRKERKKNA